MTFKEKHQRSLGGLRKNPFHEGNPLSPKATGRILLKRELVETLYRQLEQSGEGWVEATLASWNHAQPMPNRKIDHFQTIEVRAMGKGDMPWLQPQKPQVRSLEEFFAVE